MGEGAHLQHLKEVWTVPPQKPLRERSDLHASGDCSLGPEVLFDKLSSFRPDLSPPQTLGPTQIHNKRERPSFCMTKVATLPLLEQSAHCKSFPIHICSLLWAVANCPITVFPQQNSGCCSESTSGSLGKPGVWRLTLCFSVCFLTALPSCGLGPELSEFPSCLRLMDGIWQ